VTSRVVLEELSGLSDRPIIIRMPTTSRPQQRYDHRLRDLVQRTGDLTIATDLGVPRSTARGWLRAAPRVVVTVDLADLTAPELRQEILKLRRRVEKLAAGLRLAPALLHVSGFRLSGERLPDDRPSGGSYAPWIERAGACHRAGCSGSWGCHRVGFRRGADGTPRVRSTISHRALAPHRID
jgi:hypothetical protein